MADKQEETDYVVEQYEIHVQKNRITATSQAEAIKKVLEGEGEAVDNGLDYVEVCNELGMDVEGNQELVEELVVLGVSVDESSIESICSIEEE